MTTRVREILESMAVPESSESRTRGPEWVPWMCLSREFMGRCIVRLLRLGSEEFYNFCFAMQNPYLVCLCHVRPLQLEITHCVPDQYAEKSLSS